MLDLGDTTPATICRISVAGEAARAPTSDWILDAELVLVPTLAWTSGFVAPARLGCFVISSTPGPAIALLASIGHVLQVRG